MGEGFDAERYLRVAAERTLLDGDISQGPRGGSLDVDVASALVAIDLLALDVAQQIIDDYRDAADLRGGSHRPHRFGSRYEPSTGQPLPAPRVVVCNDIQDTPWGRMTVHSVSLTGEAASVSFTATESSPGALTSALGPMPTIQLTDDRGTSVPAHFSGGGTANGFSGRLSGLGPLALDTKWIDVGNVRVELSATGRVPTVVVEDLPTATPAERYLRSQLGTAGSPWHMGAPPSITAAIDTFVAAGVLEPTAPIVADVRAVLAHYDGASHGTPAPMPEPWQSFFSQQRSSGGPTGWVPVGIATPSIDGAYVALEAVESSDEGFSVQVSVSPASALAATPFESVIGSTPLTWWARDDKGNWYLGAVNSFGGSPDGAEGMVQFMSPLDPKARVLELLPTGTTQRAVITLELPDWLAS